MDEQEQERTGLTLLGSTGTIGHLALDVAARNPSRLRVVGLAAGRQASALAEQVAAHQPDVAALADPQGVSTFRQVVAGRWDGELLTGEAASAALAARPSAGVVLNGIVGAAGLVPSLAALEAGHRLALANKESLVMAGGLMRAAGERGGGELIPVDSEHSAIFQCLAGRPRKAVRRVILTASGGPFRWLSPEQLACVSPQEALRHPTWQMGPRITIDSATLFNKGMEVIEAGWLFDMPLDQIEVWVHPQSVVHGLIETRAGSLIAQLSSPDMRLPIQLALSHPESWGAAVAPCDLTTLGGLEFLPPDTERFPCLSLARRAAEMGGTAPAVANAGDEVLVAGFLEGKIPFPAIAAGLREVLDEHRPVAQPTLDEILDADRWARAAAAGIIPRHAARAAGGPP